MNKNKMNRANRNLKEFAHEIYVDIYVIYFISNHTDFREERLDF